jgi:hypothetical protein
MSRNTIIVLLYHCHKLLDKSEDIIYLVSVFINAVAVKSQVPKLANLCPWARVIEKLLVAQQGKISLSCNVEFITMLAGVHCWTLC